MAKWRAIGVVGSVALVAVAASLGAVSWGLPMDARSLNALAAVVDAQGAGWETALGELAGRRGDTALELTLEFASRPDDEVRSRAMRALATRRPVVEWNLLRGGLASHRLRPKDAARVAAFVDEAGGRGHAEVAGEAVRLLAFARNPSEDVVRCVVRALDHPKESVRLAAAETLGDYGVNGAPSVDALAKRLEDAEHSVRVAAAAALLRIGPQHSVQAATTLATYVEGAVHGRAEHALSALARSPVGGGDAATVGPRLHSKAPQLVAALRALVEQPQTLTPRAARALWRVDADSRAWLIDLLTERLLARDPGVRHNAHDTLWTLAEVTPDVTPLLMSLLDYPTASVGERARRTLRRMEDRLPRRAINAQIYAERRR